MEIQDYVVLSYGIFSGLLALTMLWAVKSFWMTKKQLAQINKEVGNEAKA